MRKFYLEYRDSAKLQPLVREISWSHNLVVLWCCKDDLEREFYIRMTKKFGWLKNVLIHQIENQTYKKSMLGQTNVVEYAPHEANKPIGVATYAMAKTLPKALQGQLPSPREIAALLEGI